MSQRSIPFEDPDLVFNPEPRCPCLVLADTSVSMAGDPIRELNDGLQAFRREILADGLATQRVEFGLIGFGPVRTIVGFQTLDEVLLPRLQADGDTPTGQAIKTGLAMIEQRKQAYRAAGVSYYRPWVFLVTDGRPTDHWEPAAGMVRAGDNAAAKAFSFFAVGVHGADMATLSQICSPSRPPVRLQGLNFREMFAWLSASMKAVSQSQPGSAITVPPPGWTEA